MCILKNKKELNEVKVQLKNYEETINNLKKEIELYKHSKSVLLNKIETLVNENSCNETKEQSILLAKELLHLWSFREERRDEPFGGFSNIEWGGISGNIVRGLQAYIKEEIGQQEQQDIEWMFNMFKEYDGQL